MKIIKNTSLFNLKFLKQSLLSNGILPVFVSEGRNKLAMTRFCLNQVPKKVLEVNIRIHSIVLTADPRPHSNVAKGIVKYSEFLKTVPTYKSLSRET